MDNDRWEKLCKSQRGVSHGKFYELMNLLVLSPALGKVELLTEIEQANLWACEEVIGSGWQTFVQVGVALAQTRDDRLYKVDFDTFERYCQVDGRNYVNRLISAAQVFTHLVTPLVTKPNPSMKGKCGRWLALPPTKLKWRGSGRCK